MGIFAGYRFKKRHVFYLILICAAMVVAGRYVSFTDYVMVPLVRERSPANARSRYMYTVPLDPDSSWPKFRGNALQNGRSDVTPRRSILKPWRFQTGKGIFSSPVIDGDGTVYIGSADQYFYAITEGGDLKWKRLTGEIIDSAALLDDRGRVYVGSGDARVYALDRSSGKVLWTFKAHSPQAVTEQFGIKTYNLNWFEGNVAMLPDGTILAPNDNYLIYRLDRDTGTSAGPFVINEMGWSLPAVNARTGKVFTGSNFMALKNVYCFDVQTGSADWTNGGFGTNAASVMLTSMDHDGAAIIGGYDGYVRAFGQKDGFQIWTFGTRDHIYASPAQLKDGTIVQPSTDGTLYAIDPRTGTMVWAFDTKEPIRSSPAVDGNDNIYFGSGDGHLYCLNPDGTLRWAYRFIDDVRNDINGSPGLGRQGVVIAGENGGVFFMPYDYPLTDEGRGDPRSVQGPAEALPETGVYLFFTSAFGSLESTPPSMIDANEPLCFTLFVREKGDTIKTAIDRDSVAVTFGDGAQGAVAIAANGQFLTLTPQETWAGPEGGWLKIAIRGEFRRDLLRFGLKFFGGDIGGRIDQTFRFKIRARSGGASPFRVPAQAGDPASTIEVSRLAPANPSILPSYNQIGYDSLHYILGIVEGNGERAVVWGVGGRLSGKDNQTLIDPSLEVRFPMMLNYDRGLLTLANYDGMLLDMNGSWDMPLDVFRIAGKVDPNTGKPLGHAAMNATVACDRIEFYGKFLKLLGMSEFDTGRMYITGGTNLNLFRGGISRGPGAVGPVTFGMAARTVYAEMEANPLKKEEHVHSLLLVDEKTGRPVPAAYIDATQVNTDANGIVTGVTVALSGTDFTGRARIYYMVDTYPAAKGLIEVK